MTETAGRIAFLRLLEIPGLAEKFAYLGSEGSVLLDPAAELDLQAAAPGDTDEFSLALHGHLLQICRSEGLRQGVSRFAAQLMNAWFQDDDYGRKVRLLLDWRMSPGWRRLPPR